MSITTASEIRRGLELLMEPGQVFEVRALDCRDRPDSRYTFAASGYFRDLDRAAKAIAEFERSVYTPGIYVTLNPVVPDLLARADHQIKAKTRDTTKDSEIVRRRWLLIDIDSVRPTGISATKNELAAADRAGRSIVRATAGLGWPEPIFACSGNGIHLYYPIDLPADDHGLVKRVLAAMADRFNTPTATVDVTVHNAARIVRCPGTLARKGEPTTDRPHRMCVIIDEAPRAETVTQDDLAVLAAGRQPTTTAAAPHRDATAHDPEPHPPADPFVPFPVHCLPPVVRDFVAELAAATGTDPSFAALTALAVCAGCIGNRAAALVKRGWTEPAILWGAVVARSGTTKSPVLRLATRPLVRRLQAARAKYADELAQHQDAMERHDIALKQWQASIRKGNEQDKPIPPDPPIERRLVVSDVTVEKLGALLQDNPLGLLLVRDELAAWIGSFDRYAAGKGSDAPTWLSFHDSAPTIVDRKSGGSIFVEHAAVSVIGTIQPGVLRRVFGATERESGMLARLLLVQPPAPPVQWVDDELSDAAAEQWSGLLENLITIEPAIDDDGKPRPRLLPLAIDAKRRFIEWMNAHGRESADIASDDLAAHFAKMRGTCVRLALLFAAIDAVTVGAVSAIGPSHIEHAIEIVQWLKHEARRIYGMLVESDDDRDRRRLAELIGRKGGSISARELVQSSRAYRTVADASKALDGLADHGYGEWRQPEQLGPGAPKAPRFVLSSGVCAYRNTDGDSASGNSVCADSVDTAKSKSDPDDDGMYEVTL